jgi:hypothetical protein
VFGNTYNEDVVAVPFDVDTRTEPVVVFCIYTRVALLHVLAVEIGITVPSGLINIINVL